MQDQKLTDLFHGIEKKIFDLSKKIDETKKVNAQGKIKSIENKEGSNKKWVVIFQGVGLLIIFGSWIFENYFKTVWESRHNALKNISATVENLQSIIATDKLGSILLETYYDSLKKTDSFGRYVQSEYLAQFSSDVCELRRNTALLMNLDNEKYPDTWRDLEFAAVDSDQKYIAKLLTEANVKELNSQAYNFKSKLGEEMKKRRDAIYSYSLTIDEEINIAHSWFLLAYGIGSIFLAIAFIINNIRHFKTQ